MGTDWIKIQGRRYYMIEGGRFGVFLFTESQAKDAKKRARKVNWKLRKEAYPPRDL